MKKTVLAAAISFLSFSAFANDVTLTGEAGLTSNYVWRGVSQSDEDISVQAGAEVGFNNFNIGLWGSSVDFQDDDEASIELDLYGGYTFTLTDQTSINVGGIYYFYPGASGDLNYDFWEVNAGVSHSFTNGIEIGGSVSYSPEFFGDTGDAYYYEANATIPVYKGLYIDGHVGHSNLKESEGLEDYTDYGIGVGYTINNLDFHVGYRDTDLNDTNIADDQWSLTAKVVF